MLLASSIATHAQAIYNPKDQPILHSKAEVAAWKQRALAGPYRIAGDAYTNSPAEWQTILTDANAFRADPVNVGSDSDPRRTVWLGYPGTVIDPGTFTYPNWHGVKAVSAAIAFQVTGDKSYADAVRVWLLAQARMPDIAGYTSLNMTKWPTGAGRGAKPSFETGANEGKFAQRRAFCLDLIWETCNASERAEIIADLDRCAEWLCRTTIAKFVNDGLPKFATGDITTATGRFTENNTLTWGTPGKQTRYAVWSKTMDTVYVGRKEDGTLSYRIPFAAFSFNNRDADRMPAVLWVELLKRKAGLPENPDRMLCYKTWVKGWLTYSVFPDGTYGEYERNGDYSCPPRGIAHYGGIVVEACLVGAEMLARQGDYELRDYTTREGVATTKCGPIDAPKSLRLVTQRLAAFCNGTTPLYYGAVAPANLLQIYQRGPTAFGDGHWTHDHLLAIAGKLWPDLNYRTTYQRIAPGTTQLTGKDYSPSTSIPRFFSGTGAQFGSAAFLWGGLEHLAPRP